MGQAPVEFPKSDIRRDPFTEEDQSVLVSDEEYTVPAASPFYVQLDEVPRLDDPSSVVVYLTDLLAEDLDISETVVTVTNGAYFQNGDVIQIDDEQMQVTGKSGNDLTVTRGYGGTTPATHTNGTRFFLTAAFTEVLTTPTARQYQVHYGTIAIPYKAGLVRFSEDHAGAVVWITYYKTGHYNWAEFLDERHFKPFKVGNCVIASSNGIQSLSETTMTKLKEIVITRTGNLRIKFSLRAISGTVYAQIYKNGAPVGTLRTKISSEWEEYSEDISGWDINSFCQLYGRISSLTGSLEVKNFHICSDFYWREVATFEG